MTSRDPTTWMWAEACQLIEQADRLHRQFFRLGVADTRPVWEPPVDMFEDDREVTVVVALPGVAPDHIEVTQDARGLLIRAERRIAGADHGCSIRQLEIPHGYFERRVAIPPVHAEHGTQKLQDGCLIITLRKQG